MKLLLWCLLFGVALDLTRADPLKAEADNKPVDKPNNDIEDPLEEEMDVPEPESAEAELSEEPESVDGTELSEEAESVEGTELSEAEGVEVSERAGRCGCRARTWCRYGGRRYIYIPLAKHWSQAQRYCANRGATLASIHSRKVENYIKNYILPRGRWAWIGLTDGPTEGWFLWINGHRWVYANFCPGSNHSRYRASRDCVFMNYTSRRCWFDNVCTARLHFVCERR